MIDQISELPEDGLKSLPETSLFTENKWISRKKNQNKLYFLHLIEHIFIKITNLQSAVGNFSKRKLP